MFITGMLLFSVSVPIVSGLIAKTENPDKGMIAASTALVAWGSMLIGMFLSHVQNY